MQSIFDTNYVQLIPERGCDQIFNINYVPIIPEQACDQYWIYILFN